LRQNTEDSIVRSNGRRLPEQRGLPVAREGYPFILGSALAAAILGILGLYALAVLSLGVTFFVCFFFRDPERVIPEADGVVVSPADGKVLKVGMVNDPEAGADQMLKISIFMSIFSVHVNRIPDTGRVTDIVYHPGKFFSANLDKASRNNERNALTLEIVGGREVIVVQVAGLIARRIICKVREGDRLNRGERFGMICFGSRLDVYLPSGTTPTVSEGDKVHAGSSILGRLS
jgi:phosphatidylserine decarboxylase